MNTNQNNRAMTWTILLAALGLRLLISPHFLLVPDEANYWQWSRYLAPGYHDHPPMIAWTIWLTTTLFGQSEFSIRLPTILGLTLSSIYMCLFAARWFDWRCALQTAIVSQVLLFFNGAAFIATPDGLLLPCWAAALYHSARALEEKSAPQWLLTGLFFGLGMLSKYTMLLFLPSLFFCMLFRSTYRQQLISPWPWFGFVLGLTLLTPVIYWNAQHNWVTFRHVLYQGGIENTTFFTLRFIGDFIGSQALLISPILFILLLYAWIKPKKLALASPVTSLLLWMSLTGFLVFFFLAFHVRIYGNWTAPVYIAGMLLITAGFGWKTAAKSKGRKMWQSGLILAALMTLPVLIQVVYPALPIPAQFDRTAGETTGWKQLAKTVDSQMRQMPRPENTFVFALRYQFASELAFYMEGQPRTLSINQWTRPNVYDFWFSDADALGKDGIGLYEWKGMEERLAKFFERVDQPEEIHLTRQSPWYGEEVVQTFYLIRGYGFKGTLRWQPQDKSDIRATDHEF